MRRIFKIVLLMFFLTLSTIAFAQDNKELEVVGHVRDAVSGNPLDATVTVMKADSTKLYSRAIHAGYNSIFNVKGKSGEVFIFIFEADGYQPATMNFSIPEKRKYTEKRIKPVLLFKKRVRTLGEVTVKASKVKMVMRGDTIVYNADAFELAEGSMLDALIARLPGVSLKDGVISVNGEPVSSLLLNGENFFQGDPAIALQNLPAFTVRNVKVYNKEAEDAYITGKKDRNEKPLVMDVILKRDYSAGWMGNIEGGYGIPHNRWMGRGFLLGFADNIRITAFANGNNINNSTTAGTGGQWTQENSMNGDNRIVKEGIDYLFHNKKTPFKINGNVILTHDRNNTLTESSIRNFIPTGDTWERSRTRLHNRDFKITSSHNITFTYPSSYTVVSPSFEYADNKSRSLTRDAVFSSEPRESYRVASLDTLFDGLDSPQLSQALAYRYQDTRSSATRWIAGNVRGNTSFKGSENGSHFSLNYSGGYRYEHFDMTSGYELVYPHQQELSTTTDRLQRKHTPSYNAGVGGSYMQPKIVNSNKVRMDLTYNLGYGFSSETNDENWFDLFEQSSVRIGSVMVPDPVNTYWQRNNISKPNARVTMDMWIHAGEKNIGNSVFKRSLYSKIIVEDNLSIEHFNYSSPEFHSILNRTSNHFRPSVRLTYMSDSFTTRDPENPQWNLAKSNMLDFNYSYSDVSAPLRYMTDYRRSPDPLNVFVPNKNLKKTEIHRMSLDWRLGNNFTGLALNAHAEMRIRRNALVQARFYDRETGVSTWMPDNISGNWNVSGQFTFSKPITCDKSLELSTTTYYYHDNNVDYVSISDVPERSTVRSDRPGQTVKLTWQRRGFFISGSITGQLRTARSDRSNFIDLNLWDIRPSLNVKIPIPGGVNFSTNLNVTRRYGYNDPSFEKTEILWNAELSKSVMKGKLLFKLRAYDILGRVSPYTTSMNAQYFKEVFTNTMTRYFMLQISFRFNKNPKKTDNTRI